MLCTVGLKYLEAPRFRWESFDVAGNAAIVGPYRELAFESRTLTDEIYSNFLKRQLGNGSPMLREQKNRSEDLYMITWGVSRSVTAKVLTEIRDLSPEEAHRRYQAVAICAARAAARTFKELLSEVMVGHGAQRKIVEPAQRLGALLVHGHNQHGEAHIHTHLLLHNGGYLASKGRCYSSKDYRDIYRLQTACTERFQRNLAQELKTRLGWETKIDRNGQCQVTGYDQRIYERMTGQGKERIENYLREQNIPSTDVSRQYAALNVRLKTQEQPSYPLKDSIVRWQSQAQVISRSFALVEGDSKGQRTPNQKTDAAQEQASPKGPQPRNRPVTAWSLSRRGFRAVLDAFTIKFEMGKATVRVHDVSRFLLDTRKTPRIQAHREAFRAMRKHHWAKNLLETLEVGEKAFKEARKPRIELRNEDRVVLSKQALEQLTAAQRKELHRLSRKHDLKINLPELRQPKPERRPERGQSQSI
jgi:hypothetical protein